MKSLLLLCLFLLLPLRAVAGEHLEDVLRDQRLHGFRSVAAAMERLRNVDDAPGPDAPLDRRWRYQSAMLDLALGGDRAASVKASMAALETMATDEGCVRCRFVGLADLALYQAKASGRNRAFCVTRVSADAEPSRLARDLAKVREAGEVDLEMVPGPPAREGPVAARERVAVSA